MDANERECEGVWNARWLGWLMLVVVVFAVVVVVFVVLFQQVFAVVVAVGCSDDCVDVVASWCSRPFEGDWALVVEFDQHDRAVNSVIEDAVFARSADPCEVGFVQVRFDFVHLHVSVAVLHVADEFVHNGEEQFLLFIIQLVDRNACVFQDNVVFEGFGNRIDGAFCALNDGEFLLSGVQ